MSAVYGPYIQMGKLAQQMASHFQKDPKLAMEPLLAHFMDEVDINVAADTFDHQGFLEKLQDQMGQLAGATDSPRGKAFLLALEDALRVRRDEHVLSAADNLPE